MIREGIAEYFADLVTGRMTQEKARPYVLAHERELWERVGYVMGALITRAYYDTVDDKEQAIREILAVTDYPGFLARSGHDPQ